MDERPAPRDPVQPAPTTGIVCGGSECPTCGRQTEAMFGPCAGCVEHHDRTGKFLRRVRAR